MVTLRQRRQVVQISLLCIACLFTFAVVSQRSDQVSHTANSNLKDVYRQPPAAALPCIPTLVSASLASPTEASPSRQLTHARCVLNKKEAFQCLRSDAEVYLPFSYIGEYYELIGKLQQTHYGPQFDIVQTNKDHYVLSEPYNSTGSYLNYGNITVEWREKVGHISLSQSLPISIQWTPDGIFYGTQIAQFGLSHFSKWLQLTHGKRKEGKDNTIIESDGSVVKGSMDLRHQGSGVAVRVSTISRRTGVNRTVLISYMCDAKSKIEKYYLTGESIRVTTANCGLLEVVRDVSFDIARPLPGKERPPLAVKVLDVEQIGGGESHLTVTESAHWELAQRAADWFAATQAEGGGWTTPVKRVISKRWTAEEGWQGAMILGQAMSLLMRVYSVTHDEKYASAALQAVSVFNRPISEGGVRSDVFGLTWYEEYPAQPGLHVLNGFIYSLFGLRDVAMVTESTEAQLLLDDGLRTLVKTLPLFDSGSGTFYDLRHLACPGSAPNRARWEYHTLHVSQLLVLASFDGDRATLWRDTARRWAGYTKGERAPHN